MDEQYPTTWGDIFEVQLAITPWLREWRFKYSTFPFKGWSKLHARSVFKQEKKTPWEFIPRKKNESLTRSTSEGLSINPVSVYLPRRLSPPPKNKCSAYVLEHFPWPRESKKGKETTTIDSWISFCWIGPVYRFVWWIGADWFDRSIQLGTWVQFVTKAIPGVELGYHTSRCVIVLRWLTPSPLAL